MSFIAVSLGVGALAAGYGAYEQGQAAKQAGKYTPVDVNAVSTAASNQAASNIAGSNALEQQYNPYINALRQSSASSLGQYQTMSPSDQALLAGYMKQFGGLMGGPQAAPGALSDAASVAQKQLALGGNLDQSTQNMVMRAGASASGGFGGPGGGLGMGRDISARDLGLTSLQLMQQREQQAQSAGSALGGFNLQAQQQQLAQLLGLGGAASALGQQQYGRNMGLSQFTQGISQPQSGLSPGDIAGMMTGNTNMANNANQNQAAIRSQQGGSFMQLGGSLMTMGLGGLASSGTAGSGTAGTSYNVTQTPNSPVPSGTGYQTGFWNPITNSATNYGGGYSPFGK